MATVCPVKQTGWFNSNSIKSSLPDAGESALILDRKESRPLEARKAKVVHDKVVQQVDGHPLANRNVWSSSRR